jgi:hypothetical protein
MVLATLLIVSGSAFADTFYFASPGNNVWDGVYVNPYTANETSPQVINGLTIYCDDWNTEFSGNPTWNANVYKLKAVNVPNFKYGQITSDYSMSLSLLGSISASLDSSINTYDLYLEAVYLDQQMAGATPLQQQEYSAAEWSLFVNSANVAGLVGAINSSTSFATAVYDDLVAAQTAVAGNLVNTTGWDVIVPDNGVTMQEFLVDGFSGTAQPDNVPEPSAVILLGTIAGLLGLTKLRRRRQA